ncbi:hypothetical protein RB1493 [Rhodopirellula baltica SH 1]|uniref:Uncharacterized protein n=1 Tax=Rhodopirellula baltica (strain DSM 10527 / NCIMB 13988 / SH1) TaxID=243090 RepID=Q7UX85_RHOBA|nr:hypothetical protein RB1493 [Rhodopirellula baltica SH 1]
MIRKRQWPNVGDIKFIYGNAVAQVGGPCDVGGSSRRAAPSWSLGEGFAERRKWWEEGRAESGCEHQSKFATESD